MTYKHCSIVRDFFLFLFSNHRGFVKKSLKFLPFNHIFHAILEEQPHMAVIFNHAPQLLLANTKVDGRLGYGQGILLTNTHFVLVHAHLVLSIPYLNLSSVSRSSQGKPDIQFSRFTGAADASVATIVKTEFSAKVMDVEKRGKNWEYFLRASPSLVWGAYGGALSHEYEGICWDGISY